MTEDF